MPLILRKGLPSDAAAFTEIYFSAFQNDAISLLVFPRHDPSAYQFWHDSIVAELAAPHAHFICIVDSAAPAPDRPIAYAKWNGPGAPVATELPVWPEKSDVQIANRFFGTLVERHAEIMEGRRHWYLELLATRPESQGRGAAGKLLRWGMQRADEEGTETYLEASPDGKPIYEHFGFKEEDRLVVELEGKGEGPLAEKEFIEVFMIRPATEKTN